MGWSKVEERPLLLTLTVAASCVHQLQLVLFQFVQVSNNCGAGYPHTPPQCLPQLTVVLHYCGNDDVLHVILTSTLVSTSSKTN